MAPIDARRRRRARLAPRVAGSHPTGCSSRPGRSCNTADAEPSAREGPGPSVELSPVTELCMLAAGLGNAAALWNHGVCTLTDPPLV